jgi:predicted nucleotidyltransferase
LHAQAVRDFNVILEMIVKEFRPRRVYQWGSLIRPEQFRDYSDIDIAVERITSPEAYFRMLGKAQALTCFPVDLVQLEKLRPEFIQWSREFGTIVYEQTQ